MTATLTINECSTSARLELGDNRPKISAMRKCASTPTLRTLGCAPLENSLDGNGMEVYVVMRSFQEFAGGLFNKLPGPLQEGVRDSGFCHYMTVFRQPDGTLVQFDFGPKAGGDVHVGHGPLARLFNKDPSRRRGRKVDGDVREHKLTSLPPAHMYVGRTNLSMGDIRAWNDVHSQIEYELHRSDCRHYVNSLVRYTTGVDRITATALRHQWSQNKRKYGLASRVVQLGQFFTDVANWGTVKALGQASMATLLTFTGRQAFTGLQTPLVLQKMRTRLLPAARHTLVPVRKALTNRPVAAVGTAAVATYAATGGQGGPAAIKETVSIGARMAGGVQTAVRAAAGLAQSVGRQASTATQQTTTQALTVASSIAGAAQRGATTLMAAGNARKLALARTATTTAQVIRPGSSPPRVSLPSFKPDKSQLALVASRR